MPRRGTRSTARRRAALEPFLADPALGRAWLFRDGAAAVGYFVLTLGWSLEYGGRDAFVDELFVSRSHRGRGLGRRALEVIDEACRELGVRALHLEVEKDNFPAAELYRKRAFEDHDRRLMTRRFTEG
jgi:ribosomal protein S18 acetylase RimI-like enzyme